ncbi:hypothetical protein ABZ446_44090 [Streptomyces sp. NPDC005813]|uniref:hypothetical protein n=1 Tax=Streptomyces sp. NPDC005813 TaxID=3155592 RepID=UPI0033DF9DD0
MWVRTLCVVGAGVGLAVAGVTPVSAAAPEADLAYHGRVSLDAGRVALRMTPRNHGPNAVMDATVRLRWSAALADVQWLPDGCARAGARDVVCRTGALSADGAGREIRMSVLLKGAPSEVTLGIDTVWGGGAVDSNRANDRQRVLVLDTGDLYAF